MSLKSISSQKDIEDGLRALEASDPDLGPIIKATPHVPLRRERKGFAGLARIIIGQHVSTASASAIHERFIAHINPLSPDTYINSSEKTRVAIGLTRAKQATLETVSRAIFSGELDLEAIEALPADKAIEELTKLKGIGPWTAEVYLLFCAGHPDIFAAGDLAIREAVRMVYEMDERPSEKQLRQIATKWSPNRGIATRLFWSYYEHVKGKSKGLPL